MDLSFADELRLLTLGLSVVACALLPAALVRRVGVGWPVVLIIILVELQFVGSMIAVMDNFGNELVWYRTPRIMIAAIVALAYCAVSFGRTRK